MNKRLTPKKKLDGIKKPLAIAETPESKLISATLGERSLRDAADWLNEKLPVVTQKSHTAIWDYLRGAYPAEINFLYALKNHYPSTDARHQLATALIELRIQAMKESISPAITEIEGKKLLAKVKVKA
jgi:hypothetical protein